MENKMNLSVFNQFDFEYSPVGVKFLLLKPENISKLERKLSFCEILKEAHAKKMEEIGREISLELKK